MKTLISGNSAIAIFTTLNENGKHAARLHIYNRQHGEWVYDSFMMVENSGSAFEINEVEVKGNIAVVDISSRSFTGRIFFEKSQTGWLRKSRERNSNTATEYFSKPWLSRFYQFLGLQGTVTYPA